MTKSPYYKPLEKPNRYPLELHRGTTDLSCELSIDRWLSGGRYKIVIACWVFDDEGADVKFIGRRPFDRGVNWSHFCEMLRQGQRIADRMWKQRQQHAR